MKESAQYIKIVEWSEDDHVILVNVRELLGRVATEKMKLKYTGFFVKL